VGGLEQFSATFINTRLGTLLGVFLGKLTPFSDAETV
jgi:hypothetical protein